MKYYLYISLFFLSLISCRETPPVENGDLQLISVSVGTEKLSSTEVNLDLPFDQPIVIRFSQALDTSTVRESIFLKDEEGKDVYLSISFIDNYKTISCSAKEVLNQKESYSITVGAGLKGEKNEAFPGLVLVFSTKSIPLKLLKVLIDGEESLNGSGITNVSFLPEIEIQFSEALDINALTSQVSISLGSFEFAHTITKLSDSVFRIHVSDELPYYRPINFTVSGTLSDNIGKDFDEYSQVFYTRLDSTDKFPRVTDEALLDIVQEQTFKYFWDFAHPVSGLNRERNTSDDNVTSGGSGFGIMTIPIGIERSYISREEGIGRIRKIVDFLGTADRFHGAWSHWLSGSTGEVNPFSADDDGGDLVETSYMAMGLLTVRQYLDGEDLLEKALIKDIDTLLNQIDWNFYTQGENSLTWHWSPKIGFEKNMKVRGWNEALITYVMAAASANHGISKEVYEQGWGAGSNMINGNEYFGINLPLGRNYGGPLFFEQYSFIGLDPRELSDQYANYWEQAVNHTLINRQHCITNKYGYVGYSEQCWGLTASDGNKGYSAHAPDNDRGVISPTAALSSFPFTPQESMEAMRHFYYHLGDRLWGPYGFYDAFNITANWYTTSNIAIDQGPIILMIENYRTGLLWNLFMSAPEVQSALTKLGFTY